jgi:hypothetical protein
VFSEIQVEQIEAVWNFQEATFGSTGEQEAVYLMISNRHEKHLPVQSGVVGVIGSKRDPTVGLCGAYFQRKIPAIGPSVQLG